MTPAPPAVRTVALAAAATLWLALPAFTQSAARPAAPQGSVTGMSVEAQLVFLRTAKVVATRPIGKGVTGALRVTLSDGAITHDAAFQSVSQEKIGADVPQTLRRPGEIRFVDHYRYNIAAWEVAQLLGIGHMMPATVERSVGKPGALSWWVDDVLMDEEERELKGALPPAGVSGLARQRQSMWVFSELVRDTDRNKGNVVYTGDWRLVMLDFTRAFRIQPSLGAPATLNGCSRQLLAGLRTLTAPTIKAAVSGHLTSEEIRAVLRRRDLLVAHFEGLIAARGEAAVLY